MEIIAALIGAGVVVVSPFVPVLRPAAKAAVKGGLAVGEAAVGVAAVLGYQANKITGEKNEESNMAADAEAGAASGEDFIPVSDQDDSTTASVGLASLATTLRPAMEAAVKGGIVITDKAKVVTTAAGKQWSDLVAEVKEDQAAAPEPAPAAPETEPEPAVPSVDDLTAIRGIGPKTSNVLESVGITSFEQLSACDEAQLRQILTDAGSRFRIIDPTDWPEQARKLAKK